jgi:hypothetical protein
MKSSLLLASALVLSSAVFAAPAKPAGPAAKLPKIPSKPIAEKKELLFSDDFNGTEHDKKWHRVVDTFAFEDGMLKGTQTRVKDVPAENGKPEVKAHAAVYGLELPTKNSVVEVKIKLDGATMMDVEFDDRKFTGSHYGHLCRAQVKLTPNPAVTILDERDGTQSNTVVELKKDQAKNQAEINKIISSHSATFPTKVEAGKTYTLTVETVGDEMRVSLDGKGVAFLKSPGIGHETKSKIELGVAGQSGFFDDIKVWNAEPAKK